MNKKIKKILLYLLQFLVYTKRFMVYIFSWLGGLFIKIYELYQKYIGFYVYKSGFVLRKYFIKLKIPWDSRLIEIFGKRSTLQIVLFIVVLVVMIPHSKIYTKDNDSVAGQNTLLFELAGPGEADYSIEEVSVDVTVAAKKETRSWREGAVISENSYSNVDNPAITEHEIAAVSAGGTALTKPNILPGTELPSVSSRVSTSRERNETIIYEVQPGDVVGVIAERFGISVATLLWANDLSSGSVIRPGDRLKILPISGIGHTVKSGDTILKLAQTYDADVSEIINYNSLKNDGRDIYVGQELIIPDGIKPQPVRTYTQPVRRYETFSQVTAPPASDSTPAGSGYLWPTSAKIITQYFGWKHYGLDIAGPIGTPLYATKAGTVVKVGSPLEWNLGYGGFVKIDHGGGVTSLYAHASSVYVGVGEKVAQGQTVAGMGSTGRSTGPHIHFEIRVNGKYQNPLQYIR
ncbi:MAG: peptidoglycan DD-metalloendopeptidase family protein [Candidatus Magasanikbacteria bacterium]|nr:peptidoglycan DD-metalloendopeptidase family protein [Candidatus Magasanikbacteria bacterium]